MLEKTDLSAKMSKDEYRSSIKPLQTELAALQHRIKTARIPVIIVVEGWGTSGKGDMISEVITTLDPREFTVFSTKRSTAYDQSYPWLRRYWLKLPEDGYFTVFDRSWYHSLAFDNADGLIDESEIRHRVHEINEFEGMIAGHGTVIIKFFLHISKKEQQKRFAKRLADPSKSWRISDSDHAQIANYDSMYEIFDSIFEATHKPHSPWTIVPANDKRTALATIFRELTSRLKAALEKKEARSACEPIMGLPTTEPYITPSVDMRAVPSLDDCDLSLSLSDAEYKSQLKKEQKRLYTLSNELYRNNIPMIILYEGWDAAGKGGNIKRVAESLEPYAYRVIPIASPSASDKAHHFLYRFCRALPADGEIRIFDRTWYGRVMVEPIEGFCTRAECERAYNDIVTFEHMLHRHGMIIKKFWINVDKDEQLKRFEARQNDPAKQWKITDEDWRNREKWDEYYAAVNYMIKYTSTTFAPWEIIPSNDKKYARIATLKSINASIEERLNGT